MIYYKENSLFTLQKIHIWWKSAQQIQNIMTSIVANDSFALHTRTQFNRFFFIIDHMMGQDFKLLSCFIQLQNKNILHN